MATVALILGRLSPYKQVAAAAEAFAALDVPAARLLIVGEPRDPALATLPDDPRIRLVDERVPDEEVGLYHAAADLVLTDADKPSVRLTTPGGGALTIDDDAKTLTLTDQSGNEVTLSDKGVSIISKKDVKIEASGKVTIKGQEVTLN